ncbi:hypothetical protein ACB092_11G086100 [Castanea dentata]
MATEARPYTSPATVHPVSLYEVLKVERTASLMEIKSVYWSLAKMYHEDKAEIESNGRDFIEIHNAYATLFDPATRALYDLSLGNTTSQFSNQRGPFGFGVGFYKTRRWETD